MLLTRRSALALAATPLGVARAWAWAPGDVWNDKQPADRSEKDIQKLLARSPWAKEVKAEFDFQGMMEEMQGQGGAGGQGPGGGGPGGGGGGMGGPPGGGGGMGGPGGGGGMGGPPGGGGGMGGPPGGGGGMGGPGGMEGETPDVKVVVRWESAKPVREATKKALPSEAEGHYAIAVSGLPMLANDGSPGGPGGGRRQGRRARTEQAEGQPEGEAPSAAEREDRRKRMLARMMRSTSLQVRGKDAIAPDGVIVSDDEKGTLLLLFPRPSSPIQASDKEVAFETRMGPFVVKTKFSLKEMVYRGELAL